ncbi:unnamed protein product [Vicia faba]|uniref:RRM domain-containing protein n=1 Tax=Vicia faba TaxID=3906 RepID=A0AAV1AF20_VICFA|nr:unnamed protein product [Vicia faba]
MRPIFAGNLEYDTRQAELERLFSKYGRIERVDMKSGTSTKGKYAELLSWLANHFLWKETFRSPSIHQSAFSHDLLLFTMKMSVTLKKQSVLLTTFHLVMISDGYLWSGLGVNVGVILHHVRIRRNFAFVQYETQEDATKALECTNMSKILDRVVSVEYALRDDSERVDNYSSPRRGGGLARSPSPAYRRRASPDYGRPRSPVYDRYSGPDRRRSPDYGRNRSPDYGRNRSPEYGRYRSRSPVRRSRT